VKRSLALLPNKRATFVIRTDRRIAEVITSEVNMAKHADLALDALRP
jgi:peroxiredoxin Q/BCP